ncbi:MAG: aminoglycoside phosphotransferase family protein [Actinomycetota bacterium]|nr:aminoglycoside phosphotransferase family protein [Actinomycetota bacterium]
MLQQVKASWPRFAQGSRLVPDTLPKLSALELERSAARTVFIFGPGEFPLLVVKCPKASHNGASREAKALQLASPANVAPALLGYVGGALVQEGLPGLPLRIRPVTVGNAADVPWTRDYEYLNDALQLLAQTTASKGSVDAQVTKPLDSALGYDLPTHENRLLRAAGNDLSAMDVTVLQHMDLSAQNWLIDRKHQFVGLVDWEISLVEGVPGFDAMHAAVSNFEHAVGLVRWSEEEVVHSFRKAWESAPLFIGARDALRDTARAAGVPEAMLEPLELGFFARRLGRRLSGQSGRSTLGPDALAGMVSAVCRT